MRMPSVLPSEVVRLLDQGYSSVADHTAVGGERDLKLLSGIVAAANQIPDELIPRILATRLASAMGTIQSAIRSWEIDSRRHHISGREIRELRGVLVQCPDERKWIERHPASGYALVEPRPKSINEIRAAMAEAAAIKASCQGPGAPAYEQAHVIWEMLDADLRIALARNPAGDAPAMSATIDAALLDVLVPLKNRRAFDQDGPSMIATAQQTRRPLALVLFDIDHFKRVNDDHGGHETGDEALLAVADIASTVIDGKGTAYRLGGDEFALILPNHVEEEAIAVAERLRTAVHHTPMTSRSLTLSVSIGIAQYPAHGTDLHDLKKAADSAAYDSKNLGRNLVRMFGEPASAPRLREPARKEPEPGALNNEERRKIRASYFRDRVARCPRDEAILDVQDTTSMGQSTRSIYVSCPLCGLSEELD